MFHEEKKALIELQILREKMLEIDKLVEKSAQLSRINDLRKLEEVKIFIKERIKELENFLYPDILA
jgi:hypothetical protein